MNQQQARKLRVGDRVTWGGDPDYRGEVITVGRSGVEIVLEEETPFWAYFDDEKELEMIERAAQP